MAVALNWWSPSILCWFGTIWLFSFPQHEKNTLLGSSIGPIMRSYLQMRTFSRIRMRASIPRESQRCKPMEEMCGSQGRLRWKIWSTSTIASLSAYELSNPPSYSPAPVKDPLVLYISISEFRIRVKTISKNLSNTKYSNTQYVTVVKLQTIVQITSVLLHNFVFNIYFLVPLLHRQRSADDRLALPDFKYFHQSAVKIREIHSFYIRAVSTCDHALPTWPDNYEGVRESAARSPWSLGICYEWRTGEDRHELPWAPKVATRRNASALVSNTFKANTADERSDESGVMTQYRRHGSGKQTTWAYHERTLSQKSAVKIDSRSNWERILSQREREREGGGGGESVISESRVSCELLLSYLVS